MSKHTDKPEEHTGLMALILEALSAKGRLACPPPVTSNLPYFTRDNLLELHLDKRAGGWVANITFRHVPPGLPNCVGTPESRPLPDERSAFLAGAAIVCEIATGSRELPFLVLGEQLICAT